MRIAIKGITESQGEALVVFDCAIGQGIGVFKGVAPMAGDVRTVEFGCAEEFVEGANLTVIGVPRRPSIAREDDGVVLVGTVNDSPDGGGMEVGLGESIMLVDIAGRRPPVGAVVRLSIHRLELYDAQV